MPYTKDGFIYAGDEPPEEREARIEREYEGLLRDRFAEAALNGWCSSREQYLAMVADAHQAAFNPRAASTADYIAQESYAIADAMLRARKREPK